MIVGCASMLWLVRNEWYFLPAPASHSKVQAVGQLPKAQLGFLRFSLSSDEASDKRGL